MFEGFQLAAVIAAVMIVILSKRSLQSSMAGFNDMQKEALQKEFHSLRLMQYTVLFFSVIPALLLTGDSPVHGFPALALFAAAAFSAAAFLVFTLQFYIRQKKRSVLPEGFLKQQLFDKLVLICLVIFLLASAWPSLKPALSSY